MSVGLKVLSGPLGWTLFGIGLIQSARQLFKTSSSIDLTTTSLKEQRNMLTDIEKVLNKENLTLEEAKEITDKYNISVGNWLANKVRARLFVDSYVKALEKQKTVLEESIKLKEKDSDATSDVADIEDHLADRISNSIESYKNLNFQLQNTYSPDTIKKIHSLTDSTIEQEYRDTQLVERKKILSKVLTKYKLNIKATVDEQGNSTEETLSYHEALQQIPPDLMAAIEAHLEINRVISEQNALLKLNAQISRDSRKAEQDRTDALLNSFSTLTSAYQDMRMSNIEADAKARIESIENSKRSEEQKAWDIEAIENELEGNRKKIHNQGIMLQQASVIAEFVVAAARESPPLEPSKIIYGHSL